MIGIYIHIPFCKKKCPYCDFYSFSADENQKDSYLKAVLFELKKWSGKITEGVDSIYFGGGTPSVFGAERLCEIIGCIKENFSLQKPQITVECNPDTATKEFFSLLFENGVNRISMGVQSSVEKERKSLGRMSSPETVRTATENAKSAGINDISLDLMLGVPFQTMESLDESIDFLLSLDVKHISAYMLKIEEETPFYKMKESLPLPDEDTVCDMYLRTIEKLSQNGFLQYEISNFCKKDYESRHNLKYWHCEEYLGIGPSAHSFLFGRRFYYERDFDSFLKGKDIIDDGEGGSEQEYIMLALRLSEGLVFSKYEKRFNKKLDETVIKAAKKLERHGWVICTGKSISLTERGFLLSNSVIRELICFLGS